MWNNDFEKETNWLWYVPRKSQLEITSESLSISYILYINVEKIVAISQNVESFFLITSGAVSLLGERCKLPRRIPIRYKSIKFPAFLIRQLTMHWFKDLSIPLGFCATHWRMSQSCYWSIYQTEHASCCGPHMQV